jgi:hypothetical protein
MPVTTPKESTVATPFALLDQVPPATVGTKVVVSLIQIESSPDNIPAVGRAVTVTIRVTETLVQPPVPGTVYVIVAVPADMPVTKPEELTVATPFALLDQEPPNTDGTKVVVPATQILSYPTKDPTDGGTETIVLTAPLQVSHP